MRKTLIALTMGTVFTLLSFGCLLAANEDANPPQFGEVVGTWPTGHRLKSGIVVGAKGSCHKIVDGLVDRGEPGFENVFLRSGTFQVNKPGVKFEVERSLTTIASFQAVATLSSMPNLYLLSDSPRAVCQASGCNLSVAYSNGVQIFAEKNIEITGASVIVYRVYRLGGLYRNFVSGIYPVETEELNLIGKKEHLRFRTVHNIPCWDKTQSDKPCICTDSDRKQAISRGQNYMCLYPDNKVGRKKYKWDLQTYGPKIDDRDPLVGALPSTLRGTLTFNTSRSFRNQGSSRWIEQNCAK